MKKMFLLSMLMSSVTFGMEINFPSQPVNAHDAVIRSPRAKKPRHNSPAIPWDFSSDKSAGKASQARIPMPMPTTRS